MYKHFELKNCIFLSDLLFAKLQAYVAFVIFIQNVFIPKENLQEF